MNNIKFDYNLTKDAWSWGLIAKDKNVWGLNWRNQIPQITDELLEEIEGSSFSCSQKIVKSYIEKNLKKEYKNKVLYIEMEALKKSWKLVEKKYFEILSAITQKPIFADKFICYFTTGFMCPYNEKEKWFMVSMWHSIPFSITTICHEMMHLQFLYYYKDYLKKHGLNKDQIENLKEAFSFLLNEVEFETIILSQDSGYPEHNKLRKKLKNIWAKNKDFHNLIDEAIGLIKK